MVNGHPDLEEGGGRSGARNNWTEYVVGVKVSESVHCNSLVACRLDGMS